MADQLVTRTELATFLAQTVDNATADLLIEMATGKIQAACDQRIIEATTTALIDVDICDWSPWLALPQFPVRSVATVLIDGVTVTDYLLRMQQLYRVLGWNSSSSAPTQVSVTYTHGYPAGAQGLQLARDICLALAGAGYGNPGGSAQSEQIDDYRVTYADADARIQVSASMRDQLRAAYGIPAYITSSVA
jgi:hypothetical protein